MDLATFATKIKRLHNETAQCLDTTGDAGDRREIQGYLRAMEQVSDLIKLARDAARLEQQLARKRSLLDQDPDPDWSHLAGQENVAAKAAQKAGTKATSLPANANREEEVAGDKMAA
ncbi:MAG: hypothetical protein R3A44_30795 [Caldilineaceae bacterium]